MPRKSIKKRSKNTAAKASHRTKKDAVLALLRRKAGATIKELSAATGWQAHSVRGFLSGTVRKKLGLKLSNTRGDDGARHYYLKAAS
jgi:Protein of unknown function (DUF3489)